METCTDHLTVEQFVRERGPAFRRWLRLAFTGIDIDDVEAETTYRLLRGYGGDAIPVGYFYTTARRIVIEGGRRRSRIRWESWGDDDGEGAPDPGIEAILDSDSVLADADSIMADADPELQLVYRSLVDSPFESRTSIAIRCGIGRRRLYFHLDEIQHRLAPLLGRASAPE